MCFADFFIGYVASELFDGWGRCLDMHLCNLHKGISVSLNKFVFSRGFLDTFS